MRTMLRIQHHQATIGLIYPIYLQATIFSLIVSSQIVDSVVLIVDLDSRGQIGGKILTANTSPDCSKTIFPSCYLKHIFA